VEYKVKRDVFLNYSAIITGLGALQPTWNSLFDHQSSIVQKEHFQNSLRKITGLSLYRRDFSDMRTNITQWLMEECLAGFPKLPQNTFVIWTGIKNNVEAIESHYEGTEMPHCTSAADFRGWLTGYFGLTGVGTEINAACASSTVGAALAAQYIAEGRYDHILVAGADMVSRFVYYGFAALKAMTEDVCMPFDTNRNGLTLGDGAVALFLSAHRDSDIRVSGYGITNDANHITGPSKDGIGLSQAMKLAIEMAGVESRDVQAFCAHGTGTRYNDSMELAAVRVLFDDNPPLVFGVKGAIGHTLGAAGGIEIALCGKCLQEAMIPPTVGCAVPESSSIVLKTTEFSGNNILTSNSGFGGVNAAVFMERVP
jgi:3-oxoacyl-[acyl-carrier-protein] synthase II